MPTETLIAALVGSAAAGFVGSYGWLIYTVAGKGRKRKAGKTFKDIEYQTAALGLQEKSRLIAAMDMVLGGDEGRGMKLLSLFKSRGAKSLASMPETLEHQLAQVAITNMTEGNKRRTAADIQAELLEIKLNKKLERELDANEAGTEGMSSRDQLILGGIQVAAQTLLPALMNTPGIQRHLQAGQQAIEQHLEQKQQARVQEQPRPALADTQQQQPQQQERITPFDAVKARAGEAIIVGKLRTMPADEFAAEIALQVETYEILAALIMCKDSELEGWLEAMITSPDTVYVREVFQEMKRQLPKTRLIIASLKADQELLKKLGIVIQPPPEDVTPMAVGAEE